MDTGIVSSRKESVDEQHHPIGREEVAEQAPMHARAEREREALKCAEERTPPKKSFIADDNREYNKKEYWEKRFAEEEEYDWLADYSNVRSLIHRYLPNRDSRILVVGCGNSSFSADMYADGYHHITSLDYSRAVIERMRARHPEMRWIVMDMTKLDQLERPLEASEDGLVGGLCV
jgi:SAM-dependent methyltransferase